MPNDTDDKPASQQRTKGKKIDSLHDLTRHVQQKAVDEHDDAIANFPEVKLACRFIFASVVAIEEKSPNSIPKNAFANFLDVLSHAESFRLKISEETERAINVCKGYTLEEKPAWAQTLSRRQLEQLEGISKSKAEWRKIFIKILKRTIASDLYYLFISKPWLASDFMVRLFEYNPDMFKPTDERKPCGRSFLHLLSEPEIGEIKEVTKQRLQFVKDSHKWLEENFPNDILRGLHSEEFQNAHPPPYELHHLQSLLRYYLGHIRDISKALAKIFQS